MKAKDIRYIVVHCTAGYGNVQSIKDYWFKTKGWKTGGYSRIVTLEGGTEILYPFGTLTNGVKGKNSKCIHIAYIGGVKKDNYKIAEDTRTVKQKEELIKNIVDAQTWIVNNGGDIAKVKILGHRDFSDDTNNNGVVDSWERIKECPSFNAVSEYAYLQSKV